MQEYNIQYNKKDIQKLKTKLHKMINKKQEPEQFIKKIKKVNKN